jgi:hypothetical protein
VDAWRGHFPITSVALLALLNRAAAGQAEFSRVERVLYVACEFWAAVNALELDAHLATGVIDPLRDARFAFSAIGAEHVVDTLHQVVVPISALTQDRRSQCIAAIEEQLLRVPDSVDALIARFARRYLCEQPGFAERVPSLTETQHYYDQLLA